MGPRVCRALPSICRTPNYRANPIVHRVRRKRQRLPPSLLIENASDRVPLRSESVLPEAFPIKPSDGPPSEPDTANTFLIESGSLLTGDHQTCGTNR